MVNIEDYLFKKDVDNEMHVIATYSLEAKDFLAAAKEIAIGQSIGNPNVRTTRDTDIIYEKNLAKIVGEREDFLGKSKGVIRIAYPLENFGHQPNVGFSSCHLDLAQRRSR